LNDRFEFPDELDLFPYTKEGLAYEQNGQEQQDKGGTLKFTTPGRPEEYYKFELVGCVVHTGTVDSGHYYSFIRERPECWDGFVSDLAQNSNSINKASNSGSSEQGSPHTTGGKVNGRWIEFNDTTVRLKDLSDHETLAEECFGVCYYS
jgi:ubiquitin C-terminal hydrolase